ncbi:acetyl-CoA carboxylase biotin carboxyl carrier protein [Pandoraea sputorum]|uniref:acetyl-CoA carboxylase biotin carboxyl carrier protein n=1 Tax=Pandoraea sputorum TaxID=93222 RepID=UPI00123FDD2B|nr:biotin/lipoyl-containing protein [Pandoraea sputorum]VVE78665.1 Biotin carboxyl carrier protein of acetyl-CoA carboxylase [Pandoraea sputorum]
MTHEALASLLRLIEGTSVCEIEHDDGRTRIRLIRQTQQTQPRRANTHVSQGTQSAATAPQDPGPTQASVTQPVAKPVAYAITAGLVGTFYRSSAPDQPPFVSVGDVVQEGQTLAIVEAMKLLNSIDADRAGRVTEIVAQDGAAVTPDTVLFRITPLEHAHV